MAIALSKCLFLSQTVMAGNPYAAWMQNYGDESYLAGVQASLELFESIARQRGGEGRFDALANIFTTATQLESAFWQMGLNATNGLSSL